MYCVAHHRVRQSDLADDDHHHPASSHHMSGCTGVHAKQQRAARCRGLRDAVDHRWHGTGFDQLHAAERLVLQHRFDRRDVHGD